METANGNNGYDLLQYHTVPSVPLPLVRYGKIRRVNILPSYYTAAPVQKTTAKWLPDIESTHDHYKDKVETATVLKLMRVTGDPLYIVGLLVSITDQDVVGNAPISTQRLPKWSDGRKYCGLLKAR